MLKRLAEKHSESVAQLTLQYRMHEDICQLSNDIVYKGTLKCATEQVRRRKLSLDGFPENVPSLIRSSSAQWLMRTIDPDTPVVFVDTDKVKADAIGGGGVSGSIHPLERTTGHRKGGSIVNDTEASLVRQIVDGFLKCGMDAMSIGVICPFRAQVRSIHRGSSPTIACSSLLTIGVNV